MVSIWDVYVCVYVYLYNVHTHTHTYPSLYISTQYIIHIYIYIDVCNVIYACIHIYIYTQAILCCITQLHYTSFYSIILFYVITCFSYVTLCYTMLHYMTYYIWS